MASHSKPQRWYDACKELQEAVDAAREAHQKLQELVDEYEEWHDNLPDSLRDSATGEKLQEIVNNTFLGDIECSLDEVEAYREEAEAADLPRGFGRD